jgi:two-component system OmpR family sensor kinase
MTFRLRLAATYAAMLALSIVVLGAGVILSLDRVLRGQVDDSLRAIAQYHNTVWPQSYASADDGQKLGPCVFYLDQGGKVLYRSVDAAPPIAPSSPTFEAALREDEVFTRAATPMGPLRVLITRIRGENGATHVLEVATPLAPVEDAMRTVFGIMVALGLAAAAASLAAGRWLADRALGPVLGVTEAARELHASDLTTRLPVPARRDEIGELVEVFNQMLARLEMAFDAQRRFTADASHELRSPLTALKGEIEVARRRPRDAAHYAGVLDSALEEIDRLERILADLLALARPDDDRTAPVFVDVAALAEDVVGRRAAEAATRGLALEIRAEPGVGTRATPARLARAIDNLVANALRYTPEGRVTVVVRRAGDAAVVEVRDTGVGIPADQVDRIFDRFHRVDSSRARDAGGVGLGLAIARQIALVHGGALTVTSEVGAGSTFALRLPLVAHGSVPASTAAAGAGPA